MLCMYVCMYDDRNMDIHLKPPPVTPNTQDNSNGGDKQILIEFDQLAVVSEQDTNCNDRVAVGWLSWSDMDQVDF